MNDNQSHPLSLRFSDPAQTPYFIGALALLARLLHLIFIWNTDLLRIPTIDAAYYHEWAGQIASGQLIGDSIFFMSPLYPYLLGLVYAVFGPSIGIVFILQSLLGAFTVTLLYRWIEARLGRTVAIVSGILAALYSPFIFFDGTLLTSTLILFLSTVILTLLDRAVRNPSPANPLMLGIVLGLSALARPLALILVPVVWWVFYLHDRPASARRFGVTLLGTLAVLFVVAVRNMFVGGEFTLTTSSAGMNFYVGNNPDATGLYWEAPFLSSAEPQYEDEDYRRVASESVQRDLTTREAGGYWGRRATDWILNNPVDYLTLLGRKALYFWNRTEFANNVSIYLASELSPIIGWNPIGFWLVAPFGLAGLILLTIKRGIKETALPVGFTAAYFAGGLIFFVSSEYRLPILLPLLLGAGYLLVEIYTQFKARQAESALKLVAVALVFMPFVNYRNTFVSDGANARMDWFNIGNTLIKQDRPAEAISRFERSIQIDPYFAEGMHRLAEAYYRTGRRDEAVAIGKRAGLDKPETILNLVQGEALKEAYALLGEGRLTEAMREFNIAGYDSGLAAAETTRISHLNAARSSYEAGDLDTALESFLAVANSDSIPDPAIFHNLAFLSWKLGRLDSAITFAERAIKIDSLNAPAGYLLARLYATAGRQGEAERISQRLNPDSQGRNQMLIDLRITMDSLESKGRYEDALDAYIPYGRLTFEVAPEDKWRLGRLQYRVGNFDLSLRLLGEAEAGMVNDPDIPLYQGLALIALGRFSEAESSLQRCIASNPDRMEARLALARLYLIRGATQKAFRELDAVGHLEILSDNLRSEYVGLLDSVKAKL
jgi:tetratricopeptide (TPR) repeat protein